MTETVNREQAKAALTEHFPEYITQSCLCGGPFTTYPEWIDHVLDEMFKEQSNAQPPTV